MKIKAGIIVEKTIAYLLTVVITILVLWALHWLFFPETIRLTKVSLVDDKIMGGEILRSVVYFNKEIGKVVDVTGELLDEKGNPVGAPEPAREAVEALIKVPSNLPPGKYRIRYSYAVNPLKPVRVELLTPYFQIVEKGK